MSVRYGAFEQAQTEVSIAPLRSSQVIIPDLVLEKLTCTVRLCTLYCTMYSLRCTFLACGMNLLSALRQPCKLPCIVKNNLMFLHNSCKTSFPTWNSEQQVIWEMTKPAAFRCLLCAHLNNEVTQLFFWHSEFAWATNHILTYISCLEEVQRYTLEKSIATSKHLQHLLLSSIRKYIWMFNMCTLTLESWLSSTIYCHAG